MFTIGENIKKLRRAKDITQESLANMLHITPQAVSRWETNITSPDATLLPKLAYIFGCTTDELLGVANFNRNEKFEEYQAQEVKALQKGDGKEAIKIWREALDEMPGDYEVMKNLASDLRFIADATTEEGMKMLTEARDLYEAILDKCTDPDIINPVRGCLPFVYKVLGENDKAKAIVEQLPSMWYSKELKRRDVAVTPEEHSNAEMTVLSIAIQFLGDALSWFEGKNSSLTEEERLSLAKKHYAIDSLLHDGDTREMDHDLMIRLAVKLAQAGENSEAMKHLRTAAEIAKWRDDIDYSGGGYKRTMKAVPFKYQGEITNTVFSATSFTYCDGFACDLQNKAFDPIRSTPEFREIEEIIK